VPFLKNNVSSDISANRSIRIETLKQNVRRKFSRITVPVAMIQDRCQNLLYLSGAGTAQSV
jgi:hypothetical protein